MNILWGLVLIIVTLLLAWLGQVAKVAAPIFAARKGLAEPALDCVN